MAQLEGAQGTPLLCADISIVLTLHLSRKYAFIPYISGVAVDASVLLNIGRHTWKLDDHALSVAWSIAQNCLREMVRGFRAPADQ